jgi:hypothetical protein
LDKIIVTVLLIIAGVVGATLLMNSAMPAINQGSAAMSGMTDRLSQRVETLVTIVHATGELDENGDWQDTNGDGDFDVFAWVKNVGVARIIAIGESDVFFGTEGDFSRIPYLDDAGWVKPYWEYELKNGSEWVKTVTMEIEISFPSTQASDTYQIKVLTPDGVSDEHYFSM